MWPFRLLAGRNILVRNVNTERIRPMTSTSMTADERAAMLAQAEHEWGELRDAVAAFTDEELDRENAIGAWSVRDVMIHIANWEEELLRIVEALDAGQPPAPTITSDDQLDSWNEVGVARFHTVPLSEAREYYFNTHRALMRHAGASAHARPSWFATLYGGHLDDLLALRAAWSA
jgi:hypothetical protein